MDNQLFNQTTTTTLDDDHRFSIAKTTGSILNITWLALKNLLTSLYVGLTGNQTIAGVKTFSSTIVGNIDTADKLKTARKIGGVSFDGSANINLPGVNQVGNQDTTGNAATVTDGVYKSVENTFTERQMFNHKGINIPDYIGTLPANSADSMGEVGDMIYYRDDWYRKTSSSGWLKNGSAF